MEFGVEQTVDEIISKAETLSFPTGLEKLRIEELRVISESMKDNPSFKELFGDIEESIENIPTVSDVIQDWPSGRPSKETSDVPSVAIDWNTDKPFPKVIIALIPTSDWTTIPAHMNFGGYNSCPASEWHIAALRYWRDRYGATLMGLSH